MKSGGVCDIFVCILGGGVLMGRSGEELFVYMFIVDANEL